MLRRIHTLQNYVALLDEVADSVCFRICDIYVGMYSDTDTGIRQVSMLETTLMLTT